MYAEEYRKMMIAKYGEDGYELRQLRECILERLPLHEDFTRDDLAVLLDQITKSIQALAGTAKTLAVLVAEEGE